MQQELKNRYKHVYNDKFRQYLIKQFEIITLEYKPFKEELNNTFDLYVDAVYEENPTVYATTVYFIQSGRNHQDSLWRNCKDALTKLVEICNSEIYGLENETKKPLKLKDFSKNSNIVREMAKREIQSFKE